MATQTVVELSKHFGKVVAVNRVSFRVENGEFLCILGPSGCGKSTILRMIAGFEEPTSGDIRIDDASVLSMPANRRPTAMVFQKYTLWPHMRVYDNIAFGLKLRRLPRTEIDRKVQESLTLVGMSEYGQRFPAQLSGGQQQRVALARALVLEPKILLLDEPFSNLDAALRMYLREELRRIQQRIHITTIFVTHDQEEALTLADRIAVMKSGQIEQMDRPGNIYANPQTLFVADFIGVMNLMPGSQQGDTVSVGEMNLPSRNAFTGSVTVAIRPEDLILTPQARSGTWSGTVEQVVDLGHYRKILISIPSLGQATMKIYLPKSSQIAVGDSVSLSPTRYLIFLEGQPPAEMTLQDAAAVPNVTHN
ncbi:MAG: ABC transporter ATP-binding protein [Aggregatilineales bacterium]